MPVFQYTYLLWLLLIVPLLVLIFIAAVRRKKKVFRKIGDADLVAEMTAGYRKSSFYSKFLLSVAALCLVLLSIANLRSRAGEEKITRNGIDVMIALDVSNSMLAQDIQPDRLARAKQMLNRLMDKLNNDRIGIIVFAGRAYLQMPLTADHSAARMYLSAASPETVPAQGTVIGDALKMCYASFNNKEKKYKAVVLISDGEDHDENAEKVAGQMADEGIMINTVGIGTAAGAPLMDPKTAQLKKDNAGNPVISRLNQEALAAIAAKGKGIYRLFTNAETVSADIANALSSLEGRAVTDDSLVNYKSWFQYLLAASLLLLLIELFISEVKKVKPRFLLPKVAAVFFLMFFCSEVSAQKNNELIKAGNDAYKVEEYESAAKAYGTVLKSDTTNGIAAFNFGNALYKNKNKDQALSAYRVAQSKLRSVPERSNAGYNSGVVLQNDKKLEECIAAYKGALKLDPENGDARHNLQLALRQQQQNKKDQDKKDQDKKDKSDQNKDKPKPEKPKMSEQDAAQKLQALMQKERELQDKLHKINASAPNKPEKDW